MIFLASASPRRRKLLKEHRITHRVLHPRYDENPIPGARPSTLTKRHALGKAISLAPVVRNGVILAADTVVWKDGRVLGKPSTMKEAFAMLRFLCGKWHRVVTGVALLKVMGGRVVGKKVFAVSSKVHIRLLTETQIKSYFRHVHPLDKAGAYAIQSPRISIADRVVGSVSNVAGLPMEELTRQLKGAIFKKGRV